MAVIPWVILYLLASIKTDGDSDVLAREVVAFFNLLPCINVTEEQSRPEVDEIYLRLYYGNGTNDYVAVPLNESASLTRSPYFKNESCTIIYSFGWLTSFIFTDIMPTVEAYLSKGYNPILIDWASVSLDIYYQHAASIVANGASTAIAKAVDSLVDAGIDLCHIAGISLGGQLVGAIARKLKKPLRHLIALDPAGPTFYPPIQCVPQHLSAQDAECVEVVHTNGDAFGTLVPSGHIDFYPNGGVSNQPGCGDKSILEILPSAGCSHVRSQYLWNEALVSPNAFIGRLCNSWADFQNGRCQNTTARIGQCANSTPGKYYMTTNAQSPFGQGMAGAGY